MDEKVNLLAVILRSAEEPALNRPQLQRVMRATRAHAIYVQQRAAAFEADEDDDWDEGPEDDDGWLFEDLGVLIRLYAKLREKEQMIELIFEVGLVSILSDFRGFGLTPNSFLTGNHVGFIARHSYHLLCSARASLQGSQHCRLPRRHAELHQRSHSHGRTRRRK